MNIFYKISISCLLFVTCLAARGQTNLALTATATAFTTDPNGLYQWNQINDGNLGTCGTQQAFIWNSSVGVLPNQEMTFTWTSAKTLNKIVIHHGEAANRSLTGCTIQYWNGTTWVNHLVVTLPQQCINTITMNPVTTTAIRLTDHKATGAGQQTNMNYREIEIFGPNVNNDAAVTFLTTPNICNYTQPIVAKVTNAGKKTLDSFQLHWSVNNVLQSISYIPSRLLTGKDTQITLTSSYAFTANTTYTIKAWTFKPNGTVDSTPSNDNMTTVVNFMGNPSPPTTTNFIQCGNGKPLLKAVPNKPTDSIAWYDASVGGQLLGIGRTITGPYITQSKVFYAQGLAISNQKSSLQTAYVNTVVTTTNFTTWNGCMMDVLPSTTVLLDSITIRLYLNLNNTKFAVYYKSGTYSGFSTNPSAWTMVFDGQANIAPSSYFVNGTEYTARIPTKGLLLNGGQTYSFYVAVDGPIVNNSIYLSTATATNTELSTILGTANIGLFGATQYPGYTPNIRFKYSRACSNPSRTALGVTVKPRPTGADIVKGSTFQGQYRSGDMITPDVTEAGKTIIYNIVPPTGYSNAGYANTWQLNNITARTKYGVLVPSTEYSTVDPSGSGPGTITFKPKSLYIDSFITFSINYSDLGPYFCDSTIKRTVVVGATPWPNFKFPSSICLGDAILLDNISTIKTGLSSFMWYFGNGDSSDNQSPVYEYKAPGVYNVRLVAKSFPWGVLHDTTIALEVGELPAIKYRVNNKCQGLAVTFQNQTVVGNGVLTYDWDFGDGTPHSTVINPTHLYTTPGGYKVTLKANANGCIATLIKNAYQFARPVASFSSPITPVCAKTEIVMPNTSTILLGKQGAYWNFGDGHSSTIFDGEHAYNTAGTYSVKLLAISEFDCKDSVTRSVTIKAAPTPDFTPSQLCGKKPTKFTNKTVEDIANPIYNWTFSDNFTSALKNVTRTWPYEGPYTVTLKASYNNGCSGTTTRDINVLLQPKADFTVFDICSGESAEFVNLSEGDRANIQYFWDFGNGTNTTEGAPIRLYNPSATTTYTVTLVASYVDGCSDTTRKTITVSESPICDFTFKDLGFLNSRFTPSNLTYSKYEWFFGEGGTSTKSTVDYKFKYKGNFNVTMHATNPAGCTCQITKKIYANLGINSAENINSISIYPNPNNGNFSIINADDSKMEVEIFNVLGEKVYNMVSDSGSMDVNLEDHADGIYFIKVTVNGLTSNFKITVNR